MTPLHDSARGFELAVEAYERARPEYPREAVDAIASALRLGPGARLLDVGAGTGKFARLAAARAAQVVALDPAAAMIRRAAGVAGIAPVRGVAEALPFRDGAFDAAVAAGAFHWFDGPAALRELHRVLRPGTRLALVWNRRDDAVDWVARLSAIVNRHEAATPRYRSGDWRGAFDRVPGLFGPLEEAHHPHVQWISPAGILDRVASISFVAAMPEAGRAAVLAEVGALLVNHPDTNGHPELALPYVTDVHWCERR